MVIRKPTQNSITVVAAVGLFTDSGRADGRFPDAQLGQQIETSKGLVPDLDQSGRGATQS